MSNITRRQFIKGTVAAGTAAIGFPSIIRAQGLNEKLQVGFIGAGGQAGSHTGWCSKAGLQCIAFAEVDKNQWDGVLGKKGWEQAAGYTDWRKVFENHGKELDVVFVAVPDHTHFAPSMTAVSMGIHCYTEKPLTWSVREAQLLAAAYAKNPKVVTQMGNQGHAGEWMADGVRIRQGRRGRRRSRSFTPGRIVPSGRRAATVRRGPVRFPRPSTGSPGSARRRCGPSPVRVRAASRRDAGSTRSLSSLQLARRRRFRLRGPGRYGLPHDRRHLRDHESGLRGHRRADHHDRTRQGSVAGRHGGQEHLPRQRRPTRLHHVLVRGQERRTERPSCRRPRRNSRPTTANCRGRET